MKIFLVGLPGSGKTTLGKQVAKSLNIAFVDLDEAIEKSEKRKIAEIFKNSGEDYFRQIESELLKFWVNSPTDFLMSTGGGAPCFFDNVKIMNDVGTTIFLDVPAMEIAKRISASKNPERPLLKNTSDDVLKDQIEFLRTQRKAFYKQAKVILRGRDIKATEILGKINS